MTDPETARQERARKLTVRLIEATGRKPEETDPRVTDALAALTLVTMRACERAADSAKEPAGARNRMYLTRECGMWLAEARSVERAVQEVREAGDGAAPGTAGEERAS